MGTKPARRLRHICLATCLFAAFCSTTSVAAADIHIAAQEVSEPKYVLRQQDGQPVVDGLCVDVMRAIEQLDPDLKFVINPEPQSLARIEASLATGTLDAACGLLRTPERERVLRYIEPPVFSPKFYMAVRADDDVEVRNWDDVRRLGNDGIVLGKQACASVLRKVEGLKTDFSARDPKTNVQKLLAGRGRFFFYHSPGIEDAIRSAGAQDKVKILPFVMARQPLYIVLSKSAPAHLAVKMHKALSRLETSGELGQLLNKWSDS